MLEKIIKYLADIIVRWPRARIAVAIVRLLKIKLRHFLNDHPIISICALAGTCILFLMGPVERMLSGPEHKCYVVETDSQELYKENGDTLQFDGERPCEHKQVIAFEFFNDSTIKLSEKAPAMDLISAGIFLKETARNISANNQWHEYTVFKKANNFSWPVRGPATFQDTFLKDGCGYDHTDISTRDKTEIRQGLLLRSEGMRSNPKLDRTTWLRCNYGSTPDQPDFKICDYVYLEFFIPTIAPERWCAKKADIWDKWFGSGTSKVTLLPIKSYNELRILAQDRWIESKAKPVSIKRWEELSNGAPKICMRWIGPRDEWLGELSYWQEFASVAAIWCDN